MVHVILYTFNYDSIAVLPFGPELGFHVDSEYSSLTTGGKVNVSWDLSIITNGLLSSNDNTTLNIEMVTMRMCTYTIFQFFAGII